MNKQGARRMKGAGTRKGGGRQKRAKSEGKAEAVAVPAVLQPVVAALSPNPGVSVEEGWGSSNIVLKFRGKMFVLLVQDELVVKLPKARVDELVAASVGRRFDPRRDGRLMKEWVVLPRAGKKWIEVARESHRLVSGAT